MKILITRPEPGASATAEQLRVLGHEPVLSPCLAIMHLNAKLPENTGALVITSAQAIPALPASLHDVPVFCVGDATAGKLRAAGFRRVESAGGDADDLFRLIIARRLPGLHVLAVGERQGMALCRRLAQAGIPVLRRKAYAARPVRVLAPAALEALQAGEIGAALFYSTETARNFVRLNPPCTAAAACALSPGIAAALRGLPWKEIRVALRPSEADLMALLP